MDDAKSATATRNLVIVTLDGVRWQEVFLGVESKRAQAAGLGAGELVDGARLLPGLHRRFADGVVLGAPGVGQPLYASGPELVSLPGYLELLRGRPAWSCRDNHCPRTERPTLLDAFRRSERLSVDSILVVASWEQVDRAASVEPTGVAVSAGRHGGALRERLAVDACAAAILDAGARAWPSPGWGDYRPDRYTAALALRVLEVARPRLLFIGLGDTDEYGHDDDYGRYLSSLRDADGFIDALFGVLLRLGRYGRETTVVVTTDHGRAHDFRNHSGKAPESARVWLFAAGGAVPRRGIVAAPVVHHLSDVAPTARVLLGLPADPEPGGGVVIPSLLPDRIPGAGSGS